jgi:hypothetical protein
MEDATYILDAGGNDHYRVDVSTNESWNTYGIALSFAFFGDEVYIPFGTMYVTDDVKIDSAYLEDKLKKMIMSNARMRVAQITDNKDRYGGFSLTR